MRVREPVETLPTLFDSSLEGVDQTVSSAVTDTVGVTMDHSLDPSRLPPAQRQLFMRIQQKQHRDDIKPIAELTAKREPLQDDLLLTAMTEDNIK